MFVYAGFTIYVGLADLKNKLEVVWTDYGFKITANLSAHSKVVCLKAILLHHTQSSLL